MEMIQKPDFTLAVECNDLMLKIRINDIVLFKNVGGDVDLAPNFKRACFGLFVRQYLVLRRVGTVHICNINLREFRRSE